MKQSTTKVLTTHVGSLPGHGDAWGKEISDAEVQEIVNGVVARQVEAGIDIVNEGEWAKGGSFGDYFAARLSGFEPGDPSNMAAVFADSADWNEFGDFYKKAVAGGTLFEQTASTAAQLTASRQIDTVCTGPIRYTGQAAVQREIGMLKAALAKQPSRRGFITTTSPGCIAWGRTNEFYRDDEEFVFAIADAIKVEYEAIAQAGFTVHVDDPWLAALWDGAGRKMGLEGYKRFWSMRIEALNHALVNVPEEQVRFHVCWGSWHGPHAHDIPLADIVDLMLAINAQAYLFEAANARHEHEYALWEDVELPDGKILAPGVVSHATPLIEHPELVAQRIRRFSKIVGQENVIASTDCGLGLRCHPQIAWAKLKALADGAALASRGARASGKVAEPSVTEQRSTRPGT